MNTQTDIASCGAKRARQTLSEQVYEQLKDDIINHRIGFGEKLVNRLSRILVFCKTDLNN